MDTIVTKRLVIRSFRPDDWQDLYAYLSDASVVKYEPYEPFTPTQAKDEAARRAELPDFLAVCLRSSGKLIGNLYFAPREFGTFELGYVFAANYQGQGYATESAHALLDDAFKNKQIRRVIAKCNPENRPSWALMERLGMRREGHLRKNIAFKNDAAGNPIWVDTYEYAILAEEWIEHRQ